MSKPNRTGLLTFAAAVAAAGPTLAATGPFFSLRNTDFVVTLAFLLFVAVILHFRVPALLGGLLDKRAAGIRADLDEARALHEEARAVLAAYERRQKDVAEQAERMIESARREASAAAEDAKADIRAAIARRLAAAEDQIASAEAGAVRAVRDQAISVAVAVAGDLVAAQIGPAEKARLIDASIAEVAAKLH